MIENHPCFPRRVNAGFMQVMSRQRIRLRVFERGAGETLSCGTGACAVAWAVRRRGEAPERIRVDVPGGTLHVEERDGELELIGPASIVLDGTLEADWAAAWS